MTAALTDQHPELLTAVLFQLQPVLNSLVRRLRSSFSRTNRYLGAGEEGTFVPGVTDV